jgi:hypothetical protein
MEDTEVLEDVAEEVLEEGTESDEEGKDSKVWFPYITRAQFEKFLSRLETKIPDEIDRDYIRAIIRTPSMIYRFLRGIEAMKLIDRDQRPTPRLGTLVDQSSRRSTITEILEDLYPELLAEYRSSGGPVDRDVVTFFRRETGMGNDSANKMKMFFKYLLGESDLDGAAAAEPDEATATAVAEPEVVKEEKEEKAAEPEAERRPTQQRATRSERQAQQTDSNRSERSSNERPERADRTERTSSSTERTAEQRGAPPSRTLSEAQRAYLDTLKSVLSVNIDGDWDDDMIKLAFDRLERLFDRVRRG